LSLEIREKVRKATALKILFLQDEYRDVRMFNELMSELGVNLMFTCVAEKDHEVFYPRKVIPTLQATYTVLPGYVPSYLENISLDLNTPRPIDLSYRSRSLPYYLGDLAREKTIIAQRFQKITREHDFLSDISVREEDRIYGQAWVEFLKSSRLTLGSPSGASVIDFTSKIRRSCEHYLRIYPNASYGEVKSRFFSDVDWKIVIDTVSPRIFESAAMGCTMVMHEGHYGGILEPNVHYLCVKKDYSNIVDVIIQMRDKEYCQHLAHNAYQDLVASGEYSYRAFVKQFDQILENEFSTRPIRQSRISKPVLYKKNFFYMERTIVPNHERYLMLSSKKIIGLFKKLRQLQSELRTISRFRSLRKLLAVYAWKKGWNYISLNSFRRDIYRISIILLLQAKKVAHIPFGVATSLDTDKLEIVFTSYLNDDSQVKKEHAIGKASRTSALFVSQLERISQQEKLWLITWDHSPVGTYLGLADHKLTRYNTDMGLDGQYFFSTFPTLLHLFPKEMRTLLTDLLDN